MSVLLAHLVACSCAKTPGWLIVSLLVRFFAFVARAEEYKKWEPAQMALGLALLLLIGLLPTLERTGRPAASVELNSLLSARLQQETANLKFKHLVGGPQRDSGGASERALMAVMGHGQPDHSFCGETDERVCGHPWTGEARMEGALVSFAESARLVSCVVGAFRPSRTSSGKCSRSHRRDYAIASGGLRGNLPPRNPHPRMKGRC